MNLYGILDYFDIGSKESEVSEDVSDRPLAPANKHTSTIIAGCISNANKPKTIVGFVQNKLSTKVTPVTSGDESSTTLNKMPTENADAQSQDSASTYVPNLSLVL